MSSPIIPASEKLADLTRQAEIACKNQAWETLEQLQAKREQLIHQLETYLSTQPALNEQQQRQLALILTQARDTDAAIAANIAMQKKYLLAENAQLQRGLTMNKAYKNTTR